MPSPIDQFDLRTIDFEGLRVSVYCYKGLGAFRVDSFAPQYFKDFELWSIMILRDSTLFPATPVFRNIDDVAGAIWDLSTLLPWERPFTKSTLKATFGPMSQIFFHYKARSLEKLLDEVLPKAEREKHRVNIPETLQ